MERYLTEMDDRTAKYAIYGIVFAAICFLLSKSEGFTRPIPGFEVAGKNDGDWTLLRAQWNLYFRGKSILQDATKKFGGQIFQVVNHGGPQLVLPPQHIREFSRNPHLTMEGVAERDFFSNYPIFGTIFGGAKENIIVKMINKKLTTSLALITEPVNEENAIAIPQLWPESQEWTPTPFVEKVSFLASQVSSRIFLGAPLCRDKAWIQIAKDFTMQLVVAAYCMRAVPSIFRPIAYWILPPVWSLKNAYRKATNIVVPEVIERRRLRAEALNRGEKIPKRLDSIDWLDDVAPEGYDVVGSQLLLTFVSIHTTSQTLGHIMYDIIDNPELIPELREEIVAALREDGGFKKTTLYKMRLLDSVMKESQRVNVLAHLMMQRQIKEDVTLSDGTILPKGNVVVATTSHMQDPAYYPDALKFDGKRWLRLREQPGNISRYQFVTPEPEHIGFGYGEHACPGRFFASNEIKMMACHLLLKYDWAFKDGKRPPVMEIGPEKALNPSSLVMYKSREPEIDLTNVQASEV